MLDLELDLAADMKGEEKLPMEGANNFYVEPTGVIDGDIKVPIVPIGLPIEAKGEPIAPNPTAFFNVNTNDGIKATPNNDGTAIRLNMKSGKAASAPEKAATPAPAATPTPTPAPTPVAKQTPALTDTPPVIVAATPKTT